MPKSLRSPRHEALRTFLISKREEAGLSQAEVAATLGRYQSFVARVETGQKVLDVVELLQFADAIGFDPADALMFMRTKGERR